MRDMAIPFAVLLLGLSCLVDSIDGLLARRRSGKIEVRISRLEEALSLDREAVPVPPCGLAYRSSPVIIVPGGATSDVLTNSVPLVTEQPQQH